MTREVKSYFCPLLKKLIKNAEMNALKLPQQRRHEVVMKKFATSLFIFSGPMAYNFVYRNLPEAIPSLRTVQRIVSDDYKPLHEGVFRFQELLSHLNSYNACKAVTIGEDARIDLATAEFLTLTTNAFDHVENQFKLKSLALASTSSIPCPSKSTSGKTVAPRSSKFTSGKTVVNANVPTSKSLSEFDVISVSDTNSSVQTEKQWVKHGDIPLTRRDLQDIVNGKELSNLHIHAFQNIIKVQFPHLGGLLNPIYQESTPLEHNPNQVALQVLHIDKCHWAALQIEDSRLFLYDSVYSSASKYTLEVIARLIQSKEQSFQVNVMNVAKQSGSVDCDLYTLAYITCLVLKRDPTTVVFDKDELRPHLVEVLQSGKVDMFPIKLQGRPVNRIQRLLTCKVYCLCRLPEWSHGDTMISCNKCQERFHLECLATSLPGDGYWLCKNCEV